MKLIRLTCDQPTFHPVHFNDTGLTLIIGDSSKEKEGSSNGVGKTLILGLVQHCLGANADKKLTSAVPDWWFSLLFSHNGVEYLISRTGNGKKLLLNDKTISLKAFKDLLDKIGIFNLENNIPYLSFRSLFKRFSRYTRDDCISPTRTKKEQDFEALLRTAFLLGIDHNLILSKRNNKQELDKVSQSLKNWQDDDILKDMFRAGSQPKVRYEWLEREIPRLQDELNTFQVHEQYRAIENETNSLTIKLREVEKNKNIAEFKVSNIEKTLLSHPDISREDLLELYNGLQEIFKPETLAHFESVENFHKSLSFNRKKRLENDKIKLLLEIESLKIDINDISALRDSYLESLQGKKAFDEYAVIARQLAEFKEEKERLHDYLNFSINLQKKAQNLRERKVEQDRLAVNYASTNPLSEYDKFFAELAEIMYPRVPAGIVLDVNTGDNKIRYDLSIQIEGDDSDGINDARILCFDWLVFTCGENHAMDMLWHDNRLFADIDPGVRARWFSFVNQSLKRSGKQYIASLNTENFNAMETTLSEIEMLELKSKIVLTLRGDKAENKLLGIQFGSKK
ncbi:TPA: DUF2326 domain-containing protein [Enterobacter bugandensis]|jgi:uncharacterized protein YydD (DUF2326 family)|uniref:DUF2326 domain-containing protein n=55 Tax=Enterobacterales TaxID=91347 RepID=A0AAX2BIE6_CITAM|nr:MULTISPECIES: DUF2326 domain-containing protein [Enterobacteriaceae]ELL0331623.1 DUF2326 domain-containing protein [Serratia marcescens]ELQ6020251.1 DUF2326 domain-containing protein [Cronobacter turicensis]ELR9635874.1 DUF2326 domain-containing protein [Citrobacter farmeri]MDU4304244.1 DUF2326 domain-containing protein [Enterococcus faecalis]MDU4433826.1 DUF2326 domain-containing protein [Pluralibacter gergoviae]MDU6716684.1 DUF2326 domain-containing protein [Klebsiella michiganensis]CAH